MDTSLDTELTYSELIDSRYAIRKRLGTGQLSEVLLAEDIRDKSRYVAVKLLLTDHPDAVRQEFFRRETMALQRLDHPNIVTLLDSGFDTNYGAFFIVLEYVDDTLLNMLDRNRSNPDKSWCYPIICKVAEAISHAHSESIIHRDIKPANILLSSTGEPMICDFGTSRLKTELAVGMTVGSFWTPGYASPEQRRGEQGDEKSDVYALGSVIYHLLSGSAPPTNGLDRGNLADLKAPTNLLTLLRDMLDPTPEQRPTSNQVYHQLAYLHRQTTQLPEILVEVTNKAVDRLYEYRFISDTNVDAAREWLVNELGGYDLDPVAMSLRQSPGHPEPSIEILGNSGVGIRLKRHSQLPALSIIDLFPMYDANLENRRSKAAEIRRYWQPVTRDELRRELSPLSNIEHDSSINDLYDELTAFANKQEVQRDRLHERRELVERWELVLEHLQEMQDTESSLEYVHVEAHPNACRLRLRQPFPDDLDWPEGSPMAVRESKSNRLLRVGELISVQGDHLWISRSQTNANARLAPIAEIPVPGQIMTYKPEAQALIRRQRDAVRAVRKGTTTNPRLSDILVNLASARFDTHLASDRTPTGLTHDQSEAVRRALSARDIFMIKGPPGTGKTTVITALILEILRSHPTDRILLASQSNVPVNHVLDRLDQRLQTHHIVRIGRGERIGQGAEKFTLDHQLAAWRAGVLERTTPILDSVASPRRDGNSISERDHSLLADLEQCLEWLAECDAWIEEVNALETLLGAVLSMSSLPKTELQKDSEVRRLQRDISLGKANIDGHLKVICSLLPSDVDWIPENGGRAAVARLRTLITERMEQLTAGDANWKKRALLRDWREVVGHTEEFRTLVLDRARVIGATCSYAGGRELADLHFNWVIIDEAGRATASELLIPLIRGHRIILVGDENQLPPMLDEQITSEWVTDQGFAFDDLQESLFETLVKQAERQYPVAVASLITQQRMHPGIGQLVSEVFYNGRLLHGVSAEDRSHGIEWLDSPIIWLDTSAIAGRFESNRGKSYENLLECRAIVGFLNRIESTLRSQGESREIGLIAGYSAQIQTLTAQIQPFNRDRWQALDIEIATIDAFQGRDRDIIIYSAVRSNKDSRIGFLRDRRRLNVALSRGRQLLTIVGDMAMLERASTSSNNPFIDVIQYLRAHPETCSIYDAMEFTEVLSAE